MASSDGTQPDGRVNPPDPRLALQPEVTLIYEDHRLKVSWTLIDAAYAYDVEVRDQDGTLVYTGEFTGGFVLPPVTLQSPTFTAVPGTIYTATVTVRGMPSDPQSVNTVDLVAPALTIAPGASGVHLNWTAVSGATGYDLWITRPNSDTLLVDRSDLSVTAIDLGAADGLVQNTSYRAMVRARAGTAFGPWSLRAPSFQLYTGSTLLAALRDRLVAARVQLGPGDPSYQYPLSGVTLPSASADQPNSLLTLLSDQFGPDLTLVATTDPALNDAGDTLTLDGSMSVLGALDAPASIVWTVAADLELQMTVTVMPGDGWRLSDAFASIQPTAFCYLPLAEPRLILTSYAHTDPEVFFGLEPGLQCQATLAVESSLLPVTGDGDQPNLQTRRVGGMLAPGDDGQVSFSLTSDTPLDPLTIKRFGQAPLTLQNGMIQLSSTGSGGAAVQQLLISGSVMLGSSQLACSVDVPVPSASLLTLTATAPSLTLSLLSSGLAATGVSDVLSPLLPSSLMELSTGSLSGLVLRFDPASAERCETRLQLSFLRSSWPLVPALSLSVEQIVFEATLTRSRSYSATPDLAYGATVSGQLTLGDATYLITAGLPTSGPWYIELRPDQQLPALADIVALTAEDQDSVTGVLPPPPAAAGSTLSLSYAALLIDPAAQVLSQILLTIDQTAPWPLPGGITVSGWSIDLSMCLADGWSPTGLLHGSIGLTTGQVTTTFAVELPLPIGAGQLWTLALAEDTPIHLPTLDQIVSLLQGRPVKLPQGLATLGGLDITRLVLAFDPATTSLQQIAFAFQQSSDWTIIEDALTVSQVAADFSLLPTTTPVGVAGHVGGCLSVVGQPIDVSMLRSGYTGDWLLTAGYAGPIHVPGWTALDDWLHPTGAAGYFPATLPLASGLDLSDIALEFDGTSGSLRSLGWTVSTPALWTVIPGTQPDAPPRLAITDVRARVTMPYPFDATQITGSLAGSVTLAGVRLALSAARPTLQTAWVFHGSLLAGQAVDLVAAANSVSSAGPAYALPAEITSYNFPPSLSLVSASVEAVPDTGRFHFEGLAAFDWQFQLGRAALRILSVGGTIDLANTSGPLVVTIGGALSYAGINARLSLQLGDSSVPVVLRGTISGAVDAGAISIADAANGFATAAGDDDRWEAIVPADLAALRFLDAAVVLDLTDQYVLLYGQLTYRQTTGGDDQANPGRPSASALLYCGQSGAAVASEAAWDYALALALGPDFHFGDLFATLAVVDSYLRVVDARLVVCSIAGQTLGGLAASMTSLLHTADPAATPPLAGLADGSPALQRGVWFIACIDFAPLTLFSHLLEIGSYGQPATDSDHPAANQAPRIQLTGLINQADPTLSELAADLPDMGVAGTITLTHTDAYRGIHLSYRPAAQSQFTLASRVQLRSLFGSTYSFDVLLTANATGLTTTLTPSSQQIDSPFGLPGISLLNLALIVQYTWAQPGSASQAAVASSSQFTLQGSVLLGPPPAAGQPDNRLACTGRLVLLDGAPALVYVAITRDFSIGGFLAQCVTGSGASWPSSFIDLVLLDGSRIAYYAAADHGTSISVDGYRFGAGYTIDAAIRLTLITTLTLRALITVIYDPDTQVASGIRAAIVLDDPLDLGFLSIAGTTRAAATAAVPSPPYTGGPLLSFATGDQPGFALSAGINFLGMPFVTTTVSVTRSDQLTQLDGALTAAQALEPFGVLSCHFSYLVRQDGQPAEFRITDWPAFAWTRNIVDFVDRIKSLCNTSATGPCGQLADLVQQNAYTTTWRLAPSVAAQSGDLIFTLTGAYDLTIRGADTPFVSATLAPFSVHVPATTAYSDLPAVLAQGIISASAQFVSDLLSNPQQIALFLAMVFGQKATSVALQLACNGLVDSAVVAAADAGAAAIISVGGAVVAGAAGAAITAIVATIASSGSTPPPAPNVPAVPRFSALAYADGAFVATWSAAAYAAGYTFEMLRPDGTGLAARDFGYALGGSLPVDAAGLATGTYTGRVKARRGSQSSNWSSLTISKPAAPQPALSYTDGALVAVWSGSTTASYVAQFFDPQERQLGADLAISAAPLAASFALPDPDLGAYRVQVRAASPGQIPGDWSTPVTLTIVSLASPAIQAVAAAGTVTVSWDAAGQAGLQYEVLARDDEGIVATLTTGGSSAELVPAAPAAFESGRTYTIAVRATAPNAVSPWSIRPITIGLSAPQQLALRFDAGQLIAAWEPPAGTDTQAVYSAQLRDLADPDTLIGQLDGVTTTTCAMTPPDDRPWSEGSRYAVRVQALLGASAGPWSEAQIAYHDLPAPPDVTLEFVAPEWTVTWSAPGLPTALQDQPLSYNVSLVRADDPPVETGRIDGAAGSPATLPLGDRHEPVSGAQYMASVQSSLPSYASLWSVSNTIVFPDQVAITAASYHAGVVTLAWSTVVTGPAGCRTEWSVFGELGFGTILTDPLSDPAVRSSQLTIDAASTGRVCSIAIQTFTADGWSSLWSRPARVLLLDVPGNVSAAYIDDQLSVSWSTVPGATAYDLQIATPDDEGPFALPRFPAAETATQTVQLYPSLAAGGPVIWSVQVRAVVNSDVTEWSASATVADPGGG